MTLEPYQRESVVTEKPWGHEELWASTDGYVGKLVHIDAGEAVSLQYHERKHETIRVLRGEVEATVGESQDDLETGRLTSGDTLELPPETIHRFTAISDAELLEISTPELDDVVRLDDRYGRTESA